MPEEGELEEGEVPEEGEITSSPPPSSTSASTSSSNSSTKPDPPAKSQPSKGAPAAASAKPAASNNNNSNNSNSSNSKGKKNPEQDEFASLLKSYVNQKRYRGDEDSDDEQYKRVRTTSTTPDAIDTRIKPPPRPTWSREYDFGGWEGPPHPPFNTHLTQEQLFSLRNRVDEDRDYDPRFLPQQRRAISQQQQQQQQHGLPLPLPLPGRPHEWYPHESEGDYLKRRDLNPLTRLHSSPPWHPPSPPEPSRPHHTSNNHQHPKKQWNDDPRERDIREARDTRDARDARDTRDARDVRDARDARDTRDMRGGDSRECRDGNCRDGVNCKDGNCRNGRDNNRDSRERDTRDIRDARERDTRDVRDPRDLRDMRDARDSRDIRDVRDNRDARDMRDARETRNEPRDTRNDARGKRDYDMRADPRDARNDSRDTRNDPRETRNDARDTRNNDPPRGGNARDRDREEPRNERDQRRDVRDVHNERDRNERGRDNAKDTRENRGEKRDIKGDIKSDKGGETDDLSYDPFEPTILEHPPVAPPPKPATTVAEKPAKPELNGTAKLIESLPPLSEEEMRLRLVIDIDHTLVHSTTDQEANSFPDIEKFSLPGQALTYYVKFRPNVASFLAMLHPKFDFLVYSMGTRAYVEQILAILDPERKMFKGRIISREDHGVSSSKEKKSLEVFEGEHNSHRMLILDDRDDIWRHSSGYDNLIKIEPFVFFEGLTDNNAPPHVAFSLHDMCRNFPFPSLDNIKPYLDTISNLLIDIHSEYVSRLQIEKQMAVAIGESTSAALVDVKEILTEKRVSVLAGCHLVFSGIFPLQLEQAKHPTTKIWKTTLAFGAQISFEVDANTTHLVAVRPGTHKAAKAVAVGARVVHLGWLRDCVKYYSKINEEAYLLMPHVPVAPPPPPPADPTPAPAKAEVTPAPEKEAPAKREEEVPKSPSPSPPRVAPSPPRPAPAPPAPSPPLASVPTPVPPPVLPVPPPPHPPAHSLAHPPAHPPSHPPPHPLPPPPPTSAPLLEISPPTTPLSATYPPDTPYYPPSQYPPPPPGYPPAPHHYPPYPPQYPPPNPFSALSPSVLWSMMSTISAAQRSNYGTAPWPPPPQPPPPQPTPSAYVRSTYYNRDHPSSHSPTRSRRKHLSNSNQIPVPPYHASNPSTVQAIPIADLAAKAASLAARMNATSSTSTTTSTSTSSSSSPPT